MSALQGSIAAQLKYRNFLYFLQNRRNSVQNNNNKKVSFVSAQVVLIHKMQNVLVQVLSLNSSMPPVLDSPAPVTQQ